MLWLQYEIDISKATNGKIGLQFSNNVNEFVSFYFNSNERTYEFDRRKSGNITSIPQCANTKLMRKSTSIALCQSIETFRKTLNSLSQEILAIRR